MSEGKMDEAKGRVKEAAGDLSGDDDLAASGRDDQRAGSVKEKLSDAVDTVRDKVSDAREKVTGG